jgi:hypothetical protein
MPSSPERCDGVTRREFLRLGSLAPLGLGRCVARCFERLGAALRRDSRSQVSELLGLQREKLVSRLRGIDNVFLTVIPAKAGTQL